ncbi:unnamed protein product [Adineta steineri]|uniref:Uncharacterized protein n=1 Tax=Adineta steineri TaxID=433720 RepID=A0A814GZP9_9BILA|nr:unnamed protein product [Adineta steineri]CAF3870419.1 unnamed protein product [Adineta steineri]
MATMTKNFPLLNEIDDELNLNNIDWNKNAFQTLLTSNLPMTTIFYYAIDVGLRRLENSLHEPYWDVTADALNDLSDFLFNTPMTDDINSYLYEAKCQLLMYASIATIKLHIIRRLSINEAKMSCATMCLLLLEQSKSYETPSNKTEYSSCIRSMRFRYLKRILIIGQWLPTLSKIRFNEIYSNYERYIETMIDQLFPTVSLRDKINGFIENCLLSDDTAEDDGLDNDTTKNDFVFIQRFPKFNEKTIEKHSDLMHLGLVNTLNQLNNNNTRKLIHCVWILSCMIEADRVSLGSLSHCITREHFSIEPIDFEQKPIVIESLNERDLIVFLLLCAQQNVHVYENDSTLHPYLLYSSSHLCTQNQKKWWQTAMEQKSSTDFVNQLAIIRLDDEKYKQYPPKMIILETAKILFRTAQITYEQHSNRLASSYEQYAIQYLQTIKTILKKQDLNESCKIQELKQDKLFFFYPQKSIYENNDINKKLIKQLLEECDKLTRQCDEIKLLPAPEPPKISSPIKEEKGFYISNILSSTTIDKEEEEEEEQEEKQTLNNDSHIFVTSLPNNTYDVTDQIIEQISPPTIITMSSIEEPIQTPIPSLPPIVDMIFSHMNSVNQWINTFYVDNEGIQNDIHTIRDRLERLNRATSQMIFSNVKIFQSDSNTNNGHF